MIPPSPQGETRRLIAVSCGIQVGPTVQGSLLVSRGSCASKRVALSPWLARHSLAQRATYRDKAKAHDEAPNHDTDDDSGARQTYARRMG